MMEPIEFENSSGGPNVTGKTKVISDLCLQWPNVTFETGSTTTPYIVNAAFNSFFAVLATISNILVFLAIRKSASLHLPSKVLLISLVVADLGIGLIGQPLYVIFLIAKIQHLSGIMCPSINVASILTASLAGASILTMTLMSLDRFIAFHFHLRYRQIVTVRRACVAVVSTWVVSGFAASMWPWNRELFYTSAPITVGLCTLITSTAYLSIYRGLNRQHGAHRVNVEAQLPNPRQSERIADVSNYRKSASTMFWVYSIFLLCYLPAVCCMVLIHVTGINLLKRNIFEISQTIFLLNSSINPYVYCWRIPDVRAGVSETVRKICGQT